MVIDKAPYLDENGYPGTRQADGSWDGGDTAAIIGTVRALTPMAATLIMPLMPFSGLIPLRHPDANYWYGQPDRFSRDQMIPCLCAALVDGAVPAKLLFIAHKKKFFLTAWNTKGCGFIDMPDKFPDVCGPEVWAMWLRICNPWWAALALQVLDIETFISTLLWRWVRKDRVCRNHMLVCLMTQNHKPTLLSWLSYKLLPWQDLLQRWEEHCKVVGEYPTYDLFREAYRQSQRRE